MTGLLAATATTVDESAVAGMIVGGFLMAVLIFGLVYAILMIIAEWKIFKKAGEKGWKSIIPFYNLYIQFKLTWNTKYFWISMVFMLVGGIISALGGVSTDVMGALNMDNATVVGWIGVVVALIGLVVALVDYYWLSKSFGHSYGWFIGLLFLPNLFTLMLAFGKSEYLGIAGEGKTFWQS